MLQRIEKNIFILISVSFVLTAGNDLKDRRLNEQSAHLVEEGDRGAHSDRQGLWFGPRLGKRSLQPSEDNRDIYLRMQEAADAMKYYYDELPISLLERSEPGVVKKVIFTPKLGRSAGEEEKKFYAYTPRLGRQLEEEMRVTPDDQDIYRVPNRVSSRSRYFSPRLGRRNDHFTPRLGRELTYDNYPSIRVARSINNTKINQH